MAKIIPLGLLLIILGVVAAHARDAPLRCGGKLVSRGMPAEKVRKYCGEPDELKIEERPVRSKHRIVGSYIAQRWTYKRGSGQAPVVLEFEDDELKSISYLK